MLFAILLKIVSKHNKKLSEKISKLYFQCFFHSFVNTTKLPHLSKEPIKVNKEDWIAGLVIKFSWLRDRSHAQMQDLKSGT